MTTNRMKGMASGVLVFGLFAMIAVSVVAANPGDPVAPGLLGWPVVDHVYPAGGQRGATVDVTVVGTMFLKGFGRAGVHEAAAAMVSGKGVTARVVVPDGKNVKAAAGKCKVTLEIAPDAELGMRLLRVITTNGMVSTPVQFQIGDMPEVLEIEKPNDTAAGANPLPELPVVVNGKIDYDGMSKRGNETKEGDVDMFTFRARKGQRLVIEVAARALIPFLPQGVPGSLQAVLALYDEQGHEVANALFGYRGIWPDPVLFYDVPADGQYRLAIRDTIYRNYEPFVYRIRIGEQPFVTSLSPMGARRSDKPAVVRLSGRNLPGDTLTVVVKGPAPRIAWLSVTNNGLASTPVPFAIDDLPEVLEDESATRTTQGQKVALPVIVNGHIRQGESDTYQFDGLPDQWVHLETCARRLGSPLDSYLELLNPGGVTIEANDDPPRNFTRMIITSEGLPTHLADSEIYGQLKNDKGDYKVRVRDLNGMGGDDGAYRLKIGEPADFVLYCVPSSMSVDRGGTGAFRVRAVRKGGYKGEIRLALDAASAPGCSFDGAVIPAGDDEAVFTVSVAEHASPGVLSPSIRGRGMAEGAAIEHPVVFGEEILYSFFFSQFLPTADSALAITSNQAPFRVVPRLDAPRGLNLAPGKDTSFKVTVARQADSDGSIQLALSSPPKGVTMDNVKIPPDKNEAVVVVKTASDFNSDWPKAGNLLFAATMTFEAPAAATNNAVATNNAAAKPAAAAPRPNVVVLLPAVPFLIDAGEQAAAAAAGAENTPPEKAAGN